MTPLARLAVLLLAAAGCRSLEPAGAVDCPLPLAEQERVVREANGDAASRDDVARRLAAAGLDGRFGAAESIYYLDAWDRPDGGRWLMGVAVLFDADGRFYAVRPADTETAAASRPTPGAGPDAGKAAKPRTPFASPE